MSPIIPPDVWGKMTVWQESRGEPHEGKCAVAEVIIRRAQRKIFSDGTIPGTVLWPFQFSGWNPKDPNRILAARMDGDNPKYLECSAAWEEAAGGSDHSNGATHYYNPSIVTPAWAGKMKETAVIGHHRFMKEG